MQTQKEKKDPREVNGISLPCSVWRAIDAAVGKYGKRSPFIQDAVTEKICRDGKNKTPQDRASPAIRSN